MADQGVVAASSSANPRYRFESNKASRRYVFRVTPFGTRLAYPGTAEPHDGTFMQELQTTLPSTAPCEDAFTAAGGQRALLLVCSLAFLLLAVLSYNYLSWRAVGLNYEALSAVVGTNATLAFVGFVAFHIAIVALGLPGGGILAVTAGVLFGWLTGIAAAMAGAVLGAIAIFLAARMSLERVFSSAYGAMDRAPPHWLWCRTDQLFNRLRAIRRLPASPSNLLVPHVGVRFEAIRARHSIGILPPVTAFTYLGSVIGVGIAAQNGELQRLYRRPSPRRRCRLPLWHRLSAFPGQKLSSPPPCSLASHFYR